MRLRDLHPWNLPPREAVEVQRQLAKSVRLEPLVAPCRTVLGLDMALLDEDTGVAAAVVLRLPDLAMVERRTAIAPLRFPYIPGFLSFREIPILAAVLDLVETMPDVVICDGQGILHPRRFGLACHLGLLLDLPTIGVAKSPYVGEYEMPGERRGARSPIQLDGEVAGMVLRTRDRVKPVYVSPGHRMDTESAVVLAMSVTTRYRVPEPTRQADRLAAAAKQLARDTHLPAGPDAIQSNRNGLR